MYERKKSILDFAKWLFDNGVVERKKSFSNSIRLQKLLFFLQLFHHARFGDTLFDADFFAYREGPVNDSVRKIYNEDLNLILQRDSVSFKETENETLIMVQTVFGTADSDELSDLSHQLFCWESAWSKSEGGMKKKLSLIPVSSFENDNRAVKSVIKAYKLSQTFDKGGFND